MSFTRKDRRARALMLLLLITGALGVFVVNMLARSGGNGPVFLADTNAGRQSDRITRNDSARSAEIANDKAPSSNGNKEKELEPGDPPGIPYPDHSASSKPRSDETAPDVASRGNGSAGTGSGGAGSGGTGGASGSGGVPPSGNSGGGSRVSGGGGFGGGGFSVPPGPAGTPGTAGPASGTPAATPPSALAPIASSAGPSPSSTPEQINPMPLPQAGPAPIVTPPTGQFTPQPGPASPATPPTDTSPPGPIVTTMIGDGILRPGHSPGTATLSDLSGYPIGIEIEIAGPAADQFDVVIITGPTAIFPEGYTISFILLGDYVPTSGADFEFLLANGLEGEENILFSLLKPAGTILPIGFGYQVYVDDESDMHVRFYDANSPLEGYAQDPYTGEASNVPEPSSIALALLGLLALGWRFRRRVVLIR